LTFWLLLLLSGFVFLGWGDPDSGGNKQWLSPHFALKNACCFTQTSLGQA
jgi:hypothetical protein